MIIVKGLTGATSYTQRFECSANKIALAVEAAQRSDIDSSFVTILLVDAFGQQKVITPRTRLGDLMEIAASNEGFIEEKDTYSSGSLSKVNVLGTIELSNFGSVDLAGGYGQIQVDGAVSTTKWDFYGVDSADLTNMIIDYRPIWSAANQYKECDVRDAYAIAIPVSNLVELQMSYQNGRTLIFKPEELEAITNETNEIAELIQNYGGNGATKVVAGHNALFCIGVKYVNSIRVQYTANTTFYKVSDAVLQ